MDPYGFAVKIVREAGAVLLRARDKEFKTMMKGENPRDVVTTVDFAVNEYIINALKKQFPGESVCSEEGDGSKTSSKAVWMLDPIDGTANFSRGIPHYAICIGRLENNVPTVGAVYNPVTNELFSFKKAEGAFLNNIPIKVSATTDLKDASVFLHAGRNPELLEWGGASYTKLLRVAKKTSNYSGSALDACFVAAGRIEANIYGNLTTMDITAAIGILLEAGGRVVNDKGEPVTFSTEPQKIVMSNNPEIEAAVLKLLF